EPLGAVKTTLGESDLDMLKGGEINTGKGSTAYKQYLSFNDTPTQGEVQWTVNDDDVEGDFLYWAEDNMVVEYKVEFTEGLQSDIVSGTLEDLEDEELFMLGSVYSIVDTAITLNGALTLDLIGGDVTDTLEEGQTKTYTIEGKDYEVTALIISDTKNTVLLKVNGEVTSQLSEGDTDKLNDGTEIGIRTIIPNEAGETTGGDLVEFYLGANKLRLRDGNYTDGVFSSSGNKIEVGDENIEQGDVNIKGTTSSSTEISISYLKYRLSAESVDGNVWVPPGEGIRENLKEPQGMLSPIWDIMYEGLTIAPDDTDHRSEIVLNPHGDDRYYLEFTNEAGASYNIPFVDYKNGGTFKYGSDDKDLWFYEYNNVSAQLNAPNYVIGRKDYFVVMDKAAVDQGVVSNVLQFSNIDATERRVTFTDEAGGTIDMIYDGTTTTAGSASGELTVSGTTHTVYVYYDGTNYFLDVDLNADGDVNRDQAHLVVNGGGYLNLDPHSMITPGVAGPSATISHQSANFTLVTQADMFDENSHNRTSGAGDEVLYFTVRKTTDSKLDADTIESAQFINYEEDDSNEDLQRGMSLYGVYVEEKNQDSGADKVTMWYPDEQVSALVYVSGGETSVSGGSSGDTYRDVVAIDVGAAVLDSEVRDVEAQNLIVVGGPCANTVAMEIMGNPSPCGKDFTEGEAMIKLYQTGGGNVALLVAGYNALDTRRATRVVAQYQRYDLSGTEVVVTGTSLSDISVEAPVMVDEE
ncbi:hypothetical protein COY95_02505, partial [Candidatus Woesearchaeota archaeon CG_4_10_14_0_8_um_filter_47_5]